MGLDIAENATMNSQGDARFVVAPSLAKADLPHGHFDLVTLWDVVEHYEDPGAELREISKLLKPGGVVFL